MVSDKPLPDRCGARVVDKVGLELTVDGDDDGDDGSDDDGDSAPITDRDIDTVRLESADGSVTVDAVPNYEDVREYLWDDYTVTHAGVRGDTDALDAETVTLDLVDADATAGSPPTEHVTWVDVRDVVTNTTNRDSELAGFCEKYAMNDDDTDRCYVHQGGGAPEGNANSMTHGMYAKRTTFWNHLDTEDKQFVEALVDSWLENAPFDRDNVAMVDSLYRCAIDQLRAWGGIDEFVEDGENAGLVKEQAVFDGEDVHEVEDEHPANMPYSRLDGDIRSKLKEMGIYEGPDMQQAEAEQSLAQKLSGLGGD